VRTLDLRALGLAHRRARGADRRCGPRGLEVPLTQEQAALEPNCLGTAPPHAGTEGVSVNAVSAGTCMVSPHGCTMNFVFTDGTSKYTGTAGHRVAGGRTVIAQVAWRVVATATVIVTLAAIGSVAHSWNSGIGKDFASCRSIRRDAGLAVGDLTHGIGVAGGLGFGTDMGGIFNLIGFAYSLMTLDGRAATCANPLGI
jgi:hypothetical protein